MKRIIAVMLVLVLALGLIGCGAKEAEKTEAPAEAAAEAPVEAPAEAGEKITVTVWNTYKDHQLEVFEKIIADFNASQDKYEVVYEGQASDYQTNVGQAAMAGAGPDMLIEYGSNASAWVENGLLVDLSQYLDQETIDNLIPSALAYANGFAEPGMYLYPVIGTGDIEWFTPGVLEAAGKEAPETWDELFETAKYIHDNVTVIVGEDSLQFVTDGTGTPMYGWTSSMDETLFVVANQCGGCYNAETKEITLKNEKVIDWLTKFQKGCQEGYLSSVFVNGFGSNDQMAGITAMAAGSVAGRPFFNFEPGSTHEFQMDMADTANLATCSRSRGIMIFDYNDEDRINACCEFIKFFTNAENNTEFCKAMNYYAVLKNTLENPDYIEFAGATEDFSNVLAEYGSFYPSTPEASYLSTALKTIMGDVASGKDPEQAIDEAIATFNAQIG